jgi:hypothetical protein
MSVVLITNFIALLACSSNKQDSAEQGSLDFLNLDVRLDEDIPLVVHVEWDSSFPQKGSVSFWTGDEAPRLTAIESEFSLEHQIDLIGLLPLSEYQYTITVQAENGGTLEQSGSITTGALSSQVPALSIEQHASTSGYTLVPIMTAEGTAVPVLVILDQQGKVVWFTELPQNSTPTSAILSRDLSSAYLQTGGSIVQIPLNGDQQIVHQIPEGHHDLTEPEAGTLAYLRTEFGEYNNRMIMGDSIVELKPNGDYVEIWNFFEHIDEFGLTEQELGQMDNSIDLTHGNSIQYSEEEEAYYINFTGGVKGLVKVDRNTGETIWTLGQEAGLLYELNANEDYSITHDIAVLNEQEFLFFVNITEQSECARVAHIVVDDSSSSANSSWVYGEEECLTVFGLGGLQRLDNGNTQVVWSTAGRMEEYDGQGQLLKRIENSFGYAFGYAHHVESLYASW